MALDYNGFGLRCTTIFPDYVEQTIKFFQRKWWQGGQNSLPMTPCLLAAPTSNYLSVTSSQVERRNIRQSLGECYSLGGFYVWRQTLTSVHLLFRYFIRACFEIV